MAKSTPSPRNRKTHPQTISKTVTTVIPNPRSSGIGGEESAIVVCRFQNYPSGFGCDDGVYYSYMRITLVNPGGKKLLLLAALAALAAAVPSAYRVGDALAVWRYVGNLRSSDPRYRIGAIRQLGYHGYYIDHWREFLFLFDDADAKARSVAAMYIGIDVSDPALIEKLVPLLLRCQAQGQASGIVSGLKQQDPRLTAQCLMETVAACKSEAELTWLRYAINGLYGITFDQPLAVDPATQKKQLEELKGKIDDSIKPYQYEKKSE